MMPFYLLMLAGVAAGYYAGIAVVKRLHRGENSLIPVATAVAGGIAAYAVALNELALAGKRVVVIDVDQAPWMADRYNVAGLPTTIVFFGNREVHRAEGYHTKRELEHLLAGTAGS
jgi:hypothetical protein